MLLQDYVSRHAERDPSRVAVVFGAERATYGELEEASDRLAALLRGQGCEVGDRVCLFLAKSPAAIVSMLGSLKAGCVYVPVDVASPATRVAKIVEAAQPRAVLVDEGSAPLLDAVLAEGAEVPVVATTAESALEGERFRSAFSWADLAACDPSAAVRGGPERPAHMLFTSGSTGTPKGVVITHANVTAFVDWATGYFGTSPGDRISGHPPLHFDLSTFDIYGTFSAGAELHLVPPQLSLVPHRLAGLIRDSELTQWFAVPSIFAYLAKFDAFEHGDFPSLRRVIWCGEAMPTPVLIHWMERLPHASFTNLYGPTEATIASSYHTVPRIPASPTEPIPIGVPCAGEELLVLDKELQPVETGETGDVHIAGIGLSPGYWRDEERTAAAFLPDPRRPGERIYRTGDLGRIGEDGLVYFLGREDSQIKHRGYRIELGEIEAALAALPSLRESAIVAVETDGFEGTEICCAYSSANGPVEPNDLRGELRRALPVYMLPSRWASFERLPTNVNGKIDRRSLKEHFQAHAG